MLQALGLGGWMYTGLSPFTVLGACGDPAVPDLGVLFDMTPGNPLPYFTGLPGVFEAHVPPHHASMRAAVEAATIPAVFLKIYLQAHRLDTEFYDTHYGPGAYLRTHAEHDQTWD